MPDHVHLIITVSAFALCALDLVPVVFESWDIEGSHFLQVPLRMRAIHRNSSPIYVYRPASGVEVARNIMPVLEDRWRYLEFVNKFDRAIAQFN